MPSLTSPAAEDQRVRSAAACLICGEQGLENFLDLGSTALANKLPDATGVAARQSRYPLILAFCHACGHVQLPERVPPPEMFEDYLYMSSASDTLREHFRELSETLTGRMGLTAADLVVDIGCNDGTLLKHFHALGVRTLGVDPAENLAALTREDPIERVTAFFGLETARRVRQKWGQATLITATNTFPHIPDLHDFMQGITTLLAIGGAFIVEAHYLLDFLEQRAFDTVYHEHVSYWSLGTIVSLMQRHGLQVTRAERLPIHHGQLRVTVQHEGAALRHESVGELLEVEREHRLDDIETFRKFAREALEVRDDLRQTLRELRSRGARVAGYGAPAKASTLLSFLGFGTESLDYIVDRSPLKQGRFTPDTHIPIVAPERLLQDQPEYVLLLAWNFAEEIMAQQSEYRSRGGRFILPLPKIAIV